jgi:nitrogen-specific signal transduction histidine kinase
MKDRSAQESFLGDAARGGGIRLGRRCGSGVELEAPQLRAALGGSPQPVLIVDGFDRICFANEAAARLLSTGVERLQQTDVQRHLLAKDGSSALAEGALRQVDQEPRVVELTLRDGRLLRATLTPLCDRFGQATHVCIGLEPAQRPSAESAIEVLGRLTGELVHDINNQLSAALNYVFILQRRVGHEEPWASHLDGLQAAAWRAAALAGGLRIVGRKRSAEAESLRLGEIIEALEPLLQHVATGVRLELRLAPGLPEVRAPLAYLEQVVMMLALYALGRAPIGSTLRLETETFSEPGAEPVARLVYELITDVAVAPSRPRVAMNHANGVLRRALKRCGARLRHDERRVWVEFGGSGPCAARHTRDAAGPASRFLGKRNRRAHSSAS